MTPAETEHFAALRMHVARLHAALKVAHDELAICGDIVDPPGSLASAISQAGAALAISEPDVCELLTEADRDNALVQCRADCAAAVDATVVVGNRCTSIETASRQLLAVYRREDAGSEEWAGAMTAAVEHLAGVLPA